MKKRMHTKRMISCHLLLILMLISISCVNYTSFTGAKEQESTLHYTISFEHPRLTEITLDERIFTQIEMADCLSHNTPGNPALPLHPVNILLPQGKTLDHIKITYPTWIEILSNTEKNPVVPQQELIPTETIENDTPLIINETLYNSTEPVFEDLYMNTNIGCCRGYPILTVTLCPVHYIPKTGALYYFPEMDISISLTENEPTQTSLYTTPLRDTSEDIRIIESMVINPELLETCTPSPLAPTLSVANGLCNPEDTYEYVIITNEALNNTDGEEYNWSDLLTHRQTYSGLTTTKITVEMIDACSTYWDEDPFNDSAAHIRAFIQDAYQNWETQYIVLGGDWDDADPTNQIVPARTFTEYTTYQIDQITGQLPYYSMPCDMYYSHLDGDWRDVDHNCWGGGRDSGVNDLYAEVFVGRMTVSTAAHVSNFIKKIIWYDLTTDTEFINKTAFFGGNLGDQFQATSADYMEEVRTGDDPYFYQCIGFTEWNENNPDETFDLSHQVYDEWGASIPTDYQTIINNDDACLINHISHGSTTNALDMSTAQLNALTNTKYFFAFSQQCLAGRFTAGDTTEKTLTCINANNGAFGLIWNTGYGWASSTDTNGPNQFLQRNFWHYLFSSSLGNWQIGAAQGYAKDQMAPYIDSLDYPWCYNWYSSNFFGDPAQMLKATIPGDTQCALSDETPGNTTHNQEVGSVILSITVSDYEGDLMNITFLTNISGSWEEIGSNISQPNGTYSQPSTFPDYDTMYWWSVHVYDTQGISGWTNETYWFTTRSIHVLSPPENLQAITYNLTQINLTWQQGENATHTYIERSSSLGWTQGDGLFLYNDTGTFYVDQGLNPDTTYYYQTWSWDDEDHCWSIENTSVSNTTGNTAPVLFNEDPLNMTTNQSLNPILAVHVTDLDGDLLDIIFLSNTTGSWTQTGMNTSVPSGIYRQSPSQFTNYTTCYWWSVHCTDGINWTNETYQFTTRANLPPDFSDAAPANTSSSVDQGVSTLTILITELDDENMTWSIETSPDIGTANGTNDTSGIKSCTLVDLQYDTTYHWYVNATDNGSGTWTNQTYWFTTEEEQHTPYTGGNPPASPDEPENSPPETPYTPNGTDNGYAHTAYEFSTSAIDPEDDTIQYQFDWGDTTVSNWTEPAPSGSPVSLSHEWNTSGTYNIRVRGKDENGAESNWSDPLIITIKESSVLLLQESVIQIHVPEELIVGRSITFTCVITIEVDDEYLSYSWEFGDETTEIEQQPTHVYANPGTYQVTLTISDQNGIIGTTSVEINIQAESSVQQLQTDDNNQILQSPLLLLGIIGIGGIVILIGAFKKKQKIGFLGYHRKKQSENTLKK